MGAAAGTRRCCGYAQITARSSKATCVAGWMNARHYSLRKALAYTPEQNGRAERLEPHAHRTYAGSDEPAHAPQAALERGNEDGGVPA